ncbi:MAG: hypothetical protein D6768_20225 [Chloroflexi bacterium]|nr:MAG: hypothetical protein D6768_20225 [Chloroflexota bacterium]
MGVYFRGEIMRQNIIVLTVISLVLIVAVLLAGLVFVQNAASPHQLPVSGTLPQASLHSSAEPAADPFFTFGEPDDYFIFLDLANPGDAAVAEYTLVSASSAAHLLQDQSVPDTIQCTNVRANNVIPAGEDVILFTDFRETTPLWQRLARQLHLSPEEPFAITLGVPQSVSDNTRPVLLSMEDAIAQGLCTRLVDEDV